MGESPREGGGRGDVEMRSEADLALRLRREGAAWLLIPFHRTRTKTEVLRGRS